MAAGTLITACAARSQSVTLHSATSDLLTSDHAAASAQPCSATSAFSQPSPMHSVPEAGNVTYETEPPLHAQNCQPSTTTSAAGDNGNPEPVEQQQQQQHSTETWTAHRDPLSNPSGGESPSSGRLVSEFQQLLSSLFLPEVNDEYPKASPLSEIPPLSSPPSTLRRSRLSSVHPEASASLSHKSSTAPCCPSHNNNQRTSSPSDAKLDAQESIPDSGWVQQLAECAASQPYYVESVPDCLIAPLSQPDFAVADSLKRQSMPDVTTTMATFQHQEPHSTKIASSGESSLPVRRLRFPRPSGMVGMRLYNPELLALEKTFVPERSSHLTGLSWLEESVLQTHYTANERRETNNTTAFHSNKNNAETASSSQVTLQNDGALRPASASQLPLVPSDSKTISISGEKEPEESSPLTVACTVSPPQCHFDKVKRNDVPKCQRFSCKKLGKETVFRKAQDLMMQVACRSVLQHESLADPVPPVRERDPCHRATEPVATRRRHCTATARSTPLLKSQDDITYEYDGPFKPSLTYRKIARKLGKSEAVSRAERFVNLLAAGDPDPQIRRSSKSPSACRRTRTSLCYDRTSWSYNDSTDLPLSAAQLQSRDAELFPGYSPQNADTASSSTRRSSQASSSFSSSSSTDGGIRLSADVESGLVLRPYTLPNAPLFPRQQEGRSNSYTDDALYGNGVFRTPASSMAKAPLFDGPKEDAASDCCDVLYPPSQQWVPSTSSSIPQTERTHFTAPVTPTVGQSSFSSSSTCDTLMKSGEDEDSFHLSGPSRKRHKGQEGQQPALSSQPIPFSDNFHAADNAKSLGANPIIGYMVTPPMTYPPDFLFSGAFLEAQEQERFYKRDCFHPHLKHLDQKMEDTCSFDPFMPGSGEIDTELSQYPFVPTTTASTVPSDPTHVFQAVTSTTSQYVPSCSTSAEIDTDWDVSQWSPTVIYPWE